MTHENLFDIEKMAQKMNMTSEELDALKKDIKREFPEDEMMYELHLIRAIKATSQKMRQNKAVR